MDKLIDLAAKYVPVPLTLALLALASAFWGVHYWRGFRDYTDTLRDRSFLSIAIVVAAALCIFFVNRRPAPAPKSSPLLILPFFENDEREQYRTAFSSQLEQALVRIGGSSGSVYHIPAFLAEQNSAVQSAKHLGAIAAVYRPVVIRGKDSVKACFHIVFATADGSKPYAMVPLEMPTDIVDEIATNLLGASAQQVGPARQNPILRRLDVLEEQVSTLRSALDRSTAQQRSEIAPYPYRKKYALIIGVNTLRNAGFSLQYAVSDAKSFATVLQRLGFETTALLDPTRNAVMAALDHLKKSLTAKDLAVLYYAGPSVAHELLPGRGKVLLLMLADSSMEDVSSLFTITELAEQMESFEARHTLAVLDGCHGTTGLQESVISAGLAAGATPSASVVQVFAGSGNEEYGLESTALRGGAFTQTLIRVLDEAVRGDRPIWMHQLVAETTALLRAQANSKQTPKLVTLSGSGEICFLPGRATGSPINPAPGEPRR